MLQAQLENGHLLNLATFSRTEIEQLRSDFNFYCPSCYEKVIIRAGPHTTPHFAHYHRSDCLSSEGGEGAYHEKGKMILYRWLNEQTRWIELEPYIREIQQRPDLYLTTKRKKVAIEFQCARIPLERLMTRTKGYIAAGIQPIWILGAQQFKRLGRNHLKLDPFTLQFIHRFKQQTSTHLYFFCPNTKQFMIVSDLYITSKRAAIAKFDFVPINAFLFKDLFHNRLMNPHKLKKLWKVEKRKYRIGHGKKVQHRELIWRQWLYLKGLSIETLPSEIYLPVTFPFLMTSSQWDWQSRICLDMIAPLALGQPFSMCDCFHLLRDQLQPETNFPLIFKTKHPIQEYLELLTHLHIIEPVSTTYYKKIGSLPFYKNIEKAIKGDEQLIEKLHLKTINK